MHRATSRKHRVGGHISFENQRHPSLTTCTHLATTAYQRSTLLTMYGASRHHEGQSSSSGEACSNVTSHARSHDWTPTGPTGLPGLLFELSAPLTFYLLITYTSSSDPTPDSACLRTPAPLRSIIPFILPPYLPYSCLPACTRFLVPDSDSCPYSPDSDRTSYTDPLL